MDLITVGIGVAVFLGSATLIYFISAFSMKEKTFEEVMEEQRRRLEEERGIQIKSKKSDKTDKKKFKKGKAEKAKPAQAPEAEPEPKMVNLEIEPEMIEPAEAAPVTSAKPKGKKDKSMKPILHNKEEIAPVAAKTVESVHKQATPKDEVEMKKVAKKVEEQIIPEKKQKAKAAPPQQEKKNIESKENMPPKKGESKGTPVKQNADDSQLNGSKLISTVKSAKLSDQELQKLIEILLNRQGISGADAGSWNKKSQKGDPVPLLKKQLEEKERSLQEEQKVAMAANAKVKELATELGSAKVKFSALEQRGAEQLAVKQKELEALQGRLQHAHQQAVEEAAKTQAKLNQLEAGVGGEKAQLQKLTQENKIFQDALAQKSQEVANLSAKLKAADKDTGKAQASEAAKKTLEAKVAQYEEKIRKLENSKKDADDSLNKRVEEANALLSAETAKNQSMVSDLEKANSALASTTAEVSTLKGKLEELEAHLKRADATKEAELQEAERKQTDLQGNVKNLENQLEDLKKRLAESDTEKTSLAAENKKLDDEVKVSAEKLQAAAPASNGPTVAADEHDKIVADLKGEVDTQKAEVSDLKEQLSQQKSKNNDLSAGVSEAESYDKAVFQRLFPDVQVAGNLSHKEWVAAFEKQAASALQNTADDSEKQRLISDVEHYKNIVSETENKMKQLEKSIDEEEKKWAEKLKEAQSSSTSSAENSDSGRVSELESLVKDQESQLQEYRNILSVTESSLKALESKVASEENTWQGKLISAEAQLVQSQGELEDLKKQLSESKGNDEVQQKSMQAKVETLEVMLKESQEKVVSLTTQTKTLEKKLESGGSGSSEKEVGELKSQIESERKKNKDLCLNVVKLNGIIKTGQDALSQEQELVKKLQEQLDNKSMKSGVSEMDELEQAASSAENGTSV